MLSSILAHRLPNHPQQAPPLVLSIFLNYNSTNVQTWPHLIGSLLKQLIQNDELYVITVDLRKVHSKAKNLQRDSADCFEDIRKILVADLGLYDRFYIVADGFDEIPQRDQVALRRQLLNLQPERGSLVIITRPIGQQPPHNSYECNRCGEKDPAIVFRCRVCERGNYDLCYDCRNKGLSCLDKSYRLTVPDGRIEINVKIP